MTASPSAKAREAGTSAPVTRPARRRPSLSHLAIVAAAVLAFGFNFLALQNRDATAMVAVAARPIAGGSLLSPDLVRMAPLPADFEGIDHLVTEADLYRLEGWVVGRSVSEGQLLDRSTVIQPGTGDGLRTMSIPVPVEHAAGGTLVVGDRVDVISMAGGAASFVARGLEVVAVANTVQSGLSGVGPYYVVVGVTPEVALALAGAIEGGSVEVLRATGASLTSDVEGRGEP